MTEKADNSEYVIPEGAVRAEFWRTPNASADITVGKAWLIVGEMIFSWEYDRPEEGLGWGVWSNIAGVQARRIRQYATRCSTEHEAVTGQPEPPEGKWISVDEALPERNVEVLGYGPRELTGLGLVPEIVKRNAVRDDWISRSCRALTGITHWQPLPEPPVDVHALNKKLVMEVEERIRRGPVARDLPDLAEMTRREGELAKATKVCLGAAAAQELTACGKCESHEHVEHETKRAVGYDPERCMHIKVCGSFDYMTGQWLKDDAGSPCWEQNHHGHCEYFEAKK